MRCIGRVLASKSGNIWVSRKQAEIRSDSIGERKADGIALFCPPRYSVLHEASHKILDTFIFIWYNI